MLDRRFAEGSARTDHRMKERGAKWDFTRLSQRTWGKPGLHAMALRVTPQLARGVSAVVSVQRAAARWAVSAAVLRDGQEGGGGLARSGVDAREEARAPQHRDQPALRAARAACECRWRAARGGGRASA